MPFADRTDAGRRLGARLAFLRGEDVVVLGLPRGGVPVAFEVARLIGAPLDVLLVAKIGVPRHPELAMGAVAEGGVRVVKEQVRQLVGVTPAEFEEVAARAVAQLDARIRTLRSGGGAPLLAGRTAVVVDDGMATGSTAKAAGRAVRDMGAERVILGVPVASTEALVEVGAEMEVVCVEAPHRLTAVGQWYADFTQVSDREVIELLQRARSERGEVTPERG